jgi:hypothetical protein
MIPMTNTTPARGRTVRQRPTGNPLDPNDGSASMVKPGELVDVVELTPLTLTDRRTYNLLLAHAWDRINEDVMHQIAKSVLRGAHKSNDRLIDTIRRLMAAQVELRVFYDAKPYIRSIHLLGTVDRPEDGDDETGFIYYRFPAELREIIRQSSIFARLHTEVMFCFQSKYALALYEMIQKRGNLSHKHMEEFDVADFRKLLGVPPGKLLEFADFRRKGLIPAVQEVNALSGFMVQVDGVRHGKKVTKLKLMWWPKDEEALKSAYREVQRHRVGRKVRITGLAEVIAGPRPVELKDSLDDL